jgi:transposase
MRGVDHQQSGMFSYISAERRVPRDHPLRAIRVMVDAALKESSWRFDAVYASSGRPSIPPEKLCARCCCRCCTRCAVNGF